MIIMIIIIVIIIVMQLIIMIIIILNMMTLTPRRARAQERQPETRESARQSPSSTPLHQYRWVLWFLSVLRGLISGRERHTL